MSHVKAAEKMRREKEHDNHTSTKSCGELLQNLFKSSGIGEFQFLFRMWAQLMEEWSNYLSSRETLGALAKNRMHSKPMRATRQDVQDEQDGMIQPSSQASKAREGRYALGLARMTHIKEWWHRMAKTQI